MREAKSTDPAHLPGPVGHWPKARRICPRKCCPVGRRRLTCWSAVPGMRPHRLW